MSDRVIGYTTGVFDLFHIGHLRVLQKARSQCDFLVVGVTTDELSLSRKKKLPVIPEAERIEIVSAIKYVDQVVLQDTMDKMQAFERIGFHKVFVGDDWKGTPSWIKYEEDFLKVGVTVEYLPYTQHTSSTLLRATLERVHGSPGIVENQRG